MTRITCDHVRATVLDPGTVPGDWVRRPDAAAHIQQCPACQDWLDAFAAGEQAWAAEPADAFAAQVVARTAGVEAVLLDLPLLSAMEPGPGFAERVLRATSQKPAPQGWRARAAAAWPALVRRPRFAWEAAYVATVCWVLVFGNPVAAIEWSTTNIGAVARERLGPPVLELRADLEAWRAKIAPEPPQAPPAVRTWQAAGSWLEALTAPVVEVFRLAWESVADWFERAGGQSSGPSTEPPEGAARSPQ
ncbi:MAG: hypothetical protein R6V57_09775 [Vicinamibacterales bacterium]